MDVLSDVLTVVQMTGAVFFDVEAFSPWVSASPDAEVYRRAVMPNAEHVIAFHAVLAGSCWAELPAAGPPTRLDAGDLVVIPMGDAHVISSAPGLRGRPNLDSYRRPAGGGLPLPFVLNQGGGPDRSHFVCGYFGCDRRPFNPLLGALPRMFHASISTASQAWLLSLVRAGAAESGRGTAGGETMLAKLAELMFVEVIRKYIDALPEDARGWCSGLRDPQIGAALRLIHDRPAHAWTVDALAHAVGMSRSVFAERFTSFGGAPPMEYITRWRLQQAARLLTQRGVSVAAAAAAVGYESEAAFNRAFKKFVGVPPGTWRKHRLHGSVSGSIALPERAEDDGA
jgi:AraC-like DNA-binding protein